MDYDPYHSIRHRPKALLDRYPFAIRLTIMVGFFALLAPILMMISGKTTTKVQTTGLEGVAVVSPVVSDVPSVLSVVTLPPTVVASESPTYTDTTAVTILPAPRETPVPTQAANAPAPQLTVNAGAVQGLPDAIPVNQSATRPVTTVRPVAKAPAPTVAARPATTAAKPATTAARTGTTAARAATTAAKPATTAVGTATTAPKTATTAKPVATTAKPVAKPPSTTVKPVPTTKAIAKYSSAQVMALIRQMWPADSVDKALEVASKESGYDSRAFNGWCCYGVFQINYGSQYQRLNNRGLGLEWLYDAKVNIEIAIEIFNEQGWAPWSTA